MIVMKANVALRVDASVMNPNNVKDPAVRIQYTEFSTIIGREPTIFCFNWSKWFIVLLCQHSYAIKNQSKAPKACICWFFMAYGWLA